MGSAHWGEPFLRCETRTLPHPYHHPADRRNGQCAAAPHPGGTGYDRYAGTAAGSDGSAAEEGNAGAAAGTGAGCAGRNGRAKKNSDFCRAWQRADGASAAGNAAMHGGLQRRELPNSNLRR